MQETPGQYWEIGMYDLRRNAKIFYTDLSYSKGRQSSRRQNDSENVLFLVHY